MFAQHWTGGRHWRHWSKKKGIDPFGPAQSSPLSETPSCAILRYKEDGMNRTNPAPEMVPLPKAPALFGISRSGFYRLAGEGKVRLLKAGGRTLVCCASVRAYLATLPEAKLSAASTGR
jgi:hypothetical protein